MWRRNACLTTVLLTLYGLAAASAEEPHSPKALIAKQKWARFAIMRGRIVVSVPRGQSGTLSANENESCTESIGVHGQGDTTLVRYERKTPEQIVRFEFSGPADMVLEREPLVPGLAPLRYVQHAQGDIVVRLDQGTAARVVRGPTLWHLLVTSGESFRRELIPAIEVLRPDWRLAERTGQIEGLLAGMESDMQPWPWESLIEQLGDPRFTVRQAADRKLRQCGQAVLPYLASVDLSQLNGEQQMRLRSILESLGDEFEDSTPRVATWLANDARLWTELAHQGNGRLRQQARFQVARLTTSGENDKKR